MVTGAIHTIVVTDGICRTNITLNDRSISNNNNDTTDVITVLIFDTLVVYITG